MLASPNQPSRRNRRHGEIMYTTLNKIRERSPCTDGWETLLKHLGKTKPDDEPLSLLTILDSNGFDYALWCFRAVEGFKKEKQLLAITYAREVEHLMSDESKKSLDVFERYANGLATQEEFDAAREAARDADAAAAAAARAAAWADAADAAAAHASWAAAVVACADAVYDAAASAADAARAAAAWAAEAAAARAAYSTIKAKQKTQLRQLLDKSCTQP